MTKSISPLCALGGHCLLLMLCFFGQVWASFSSPSVSAVYRQRMRDFVQNISQYAKSVNPNFIVIPQNGHDIIMDDYDPNDTPNQDYLQAIDGLGREDLFYGYERDNKREEVDLVLGERPDAGR